MNFTGLEVQSRSSNYPKGKSKIKIAITNSSMMPSEEESEINLAALKRVDSEINEIVDSATQVSLYQYSSQTGHWTKTDTEGALFIYAHRNAHERGIIILNRLSLNNYVQPLDSEIEFKIKSPFLIYKSKGDIFGAWFFVEEECTRIGTLCTNLVQYLRKRGKHSTENHKPETSQLQNLFEPLRREATSSKNTGPDIMNLLRQAQNGENTKKPKQPLAQSNVARSSILTPPNSKATNGNKNGSARKQGDKNGVPVVHKPVPTRALPSSVEQLFNSAKKKQPEPLMTGEISIHHLLGMAKNDFPTPDMTTPAKPIPIPQSIGVTSTPKESPINDCMASILNKLNESAQKIAKEAEVLRTSPTEESILRSLLQSQSVESSTPLAVAGAEKKLTLITPEMLEESLSQGPPSPPGILSRLELKSTLVHLLENDDEFLNKIHNAYVQGTSSRRSLP